MFYYFKLHQEDFYKHYGLRSNVESTFSMLKRKFNGKLMFKKEVAQVNEALGKVLCHNICILNREFYEGNVKLGFKELAHLMPSLHIKSENPALLV